MALGVGAVRGLAAIGDAHQAAFIPSGEPWLVGAAEQVSSQTNVEERPCKSQM